MSERFDIVIGGDGEQFAKEAQKAVAAINSTEAATERAAQREQKLGRMREQLANLQRRARREAFDALPAEERLNALLQRRESLQQRIAQAAGNERRLTALKLAQSINEQSIGVVQKQVGRERTVAASTVTAASEAAARTAAAENEAAARTAAAENEAVAQAIAAKQEAREKKVSNLRLQTANLQKRATQEAFNALPLEERINSLLERRHKLAERIATAEAKGQAARVAALKLSQGINTQQLTGLQKQIVTPVTPPTFLGRMANSLKSQVGIMAASIGGFFALDRLVSSGLQKRYELMDYASRIGKLSGRAGVSTDTMQGFEFAGVKSEVSAEEVGQAFKFLKLSINKARQPSGKDQQDDFAAFGISLDDLRNKSPEQIFMKMGHAAGPAGKAVAGVTEAVNLLGRSGDRMLAAFQDGFAKNVEGFHAMGGAIDADVIQKLKEAKDEAEALGLRFNKIIATPFSQFFTGVGSLLMDIQAVAGGLLPLGNVLGTIAGGGSFSEVLRSTLPDVVGPIHEIMIRRDAEAEARKKARDQIEVTKQRIGTTVTRIEGTTDPAEIARLQELARTQRAHLAFLQTGVNPERDRERNIATMEKRIAAADKAAAFDALTLEEKRTELVRRRDELTTKIATTNDKEAALGFREEQQGVEKALRGLEKPAEPGASNIRPQADDLARIGGFQSAAGNAQVSVARDHLNLARMVNDKIGKMSTDVSDLKRIVGDFVR